MQFKVMIALAQLNKVYDGLAAYWSLCTDLEINPQPHVLFQKTLAIVTHDRTLADMENPVPRPAEQAYHDALYLQSQRNIAALRNARYPGIRLRTVSHLFLD